MLTLESARERYEHDPEFRALVITLEMAIERLQFTPSELRAAVMFAAIRREERRRHPVLRLHSSDGRIEERCERCNAFFPRGAEHKCGANATATFDSGWIDDGVNNRSIRISSGGTPGEPLRAAASEGPAAAVAYCPVCGAVATGDHRCTESHFAPYELTIKNEE